MGPNEHELEKGESVSEDNKDDLCSICLLPLDNDILTTDCEHKFHKECLSPWITKNCRTGSNFSCPLCRTSLPCNLEHLTDSEIQLLLFQAINDKNLEKIKFILEKKNHLKNESNKLFSNMTPLIYALTGPNNDKKEIVKFLIYNLNNNELMEESNTTSSSADTALSMAISTKKVESAILLIEKLEASDLNKRIKKFEVNSVFELAINKSKQDSNLDSIIVKLLEKEGFNLNIQPSPSDEDEVTPHINKIPLILAIKNGKIDIANLLIDKGAKVNLEALNEINKKISQEKDTDTDVKTKYKNLKKKISSKLSRNTKFRRFLSLFGGIKTRKIKRRKYRTKRKKSLKKKSFKKRKKTRRR